MTGFGDPRFHRTRTKLLAAFREMTEDGLRGEQALQRIADAAPVTRAELSAQFAGIDELAAAALIAELDVVATMDFTYRLEGKVTGTETSRGSLVHILRFLDERRSLYRDAFEHASALTDEVEDALAAYSLMILRARGVTSTHPEVTAHVMASGVMGAIFWWLRDDHDITLDELATAISRALPSDFAV